MEDFIMFTRTGIITHNSLTFADQGEFETEMRSHYNFAGVEAKRIPFESSPYEASFNSETQEYTLLTHFADQATHDSCYSDPDFHQALLDILAAGFNYSATFETT
jgi:hypothetical protein